MKKTIEFLKQLKENNNREWFDANKKLYEDAKAEFEGMVNRLIAGIRSFDPEIGKVTAKECVFRIYRDVRFSKDKSPYKTNMGAYISKGGRKGMYAGYYIHADPESPMLAGGIYMPPADVLKRVRQEIYFHSGEFKKIINGSEFRKTFKLMQDDKLKNPPKDFPADFEDIDLLKYKSYTVLHELATGQLFKDGFAEYAAGVFKVMVPFNKFLNRGLGMGE
ncbi:MAG: DUF2461 domain-containing protein [Bacteroidetes bacterium]|nr:DUF2461 domain-containing protein [Bacteroidota bacterium]